MLINLAVAKQHLRVIGTDDDVDIALKCSAAELAASQFINRNIYADQGTLTAAVAAFPASLATATTAYSTAMTAASLIEDADLQSMAILSAQNAYTAAQNTARMTIQGVVIDDLLTAGILLLLGDMYAQREDTVIGYTVMAVPNGARALLWPYRMALGV